MGISSDFGRINGCGVILCDLFSRLIHCVALKIVQQEVVSHLCIPLLENCILV